MKAVAAVVHGVGESFRLEEVNLDPPRPDEVMVRVVATGVCRTDLKTKDRPTQVPFVPIVYGHEGAGEVIEVGARIQSLRPGDHVVMSYMSCGQCPPCKQGHIFYCEQTYPLNFSGLRRDGTSPLSLKGQSIRGAFFGQSSFATHCIANERNVFKVDDAWPLDVMGPLGCSLQTGAGAVFNVLRPAPGSSLVVFGCGPVGLSAVMAAHAIGCFPIVAVDLQSSRLNLAEELGASHTIKANEHDPVKMIRGIKKGGVHNGLDTVGQYSSLEQTIGSVAPKGRCGFFTPPLGDSAKFDWSKLFMGRRLQGIVQGESVPDEMIPRLMAMWREGSFPFEKLIQSYPLNEINRVVEDLQAGTAIKPVLHMDTAA